MAPCLLYVYNVMCVFVRVYVYVHGVFYICGCLCGDVYVCVSLYDLDVYTYLSRYILCVFVYMFTYTYLSIHVYVYVCVYICLCLYLDVYSYIEV